MNPGIPLTRGKTTIVDDDDYEKLSIYTWYAARCHGRDYARRWDGKRSNCSMHRVIMGEPDGFVDHINGDGLDNRKANLRVVTPAQNVHNALQPLHERTLRCVHRQKNRYIVRFTHLGQDVYVGSFENLDEAAFLANEKLDELRAGFGLRNKVNYDSLLAELYARKENLDALIQRVMETERAARIASEQKAKILADAIAGRA